MGAEGLGFLLVLLGEFGVVDDTSPFFIHSIHKIVHLLLIQLHTNLGKPTAAPDS